MRCRECAAEAAVTARACSRCGAPIVGQPTVVGAVIRHLRESYEGTNVAGVVLMCASVLVGIFMIVGAVALIDNDRDLAAHGVRTQGQVVEANAGGWDKVVYTVGATDYEVPEDPDVGDRLPGDAVTVVYDPRDPANSNLEVDSVTRHGHWFFLGFGLFLLGWPAWLVVAGVFEADGPVGRRLARTRPARRQPETPPTPPGDTAVGAVSDTAVSDAAGKAVAAGVAGQPPEPYVPGSGARVPAELRLVLAGYVGVACGLFVGALACAAAAVFPYFFADYVFYYVDYVDPDGGDVAEVIGAVIVIGSFVAVGACIWALWRALKTLKAGSRFSGLLRRPSDARTATVMASERGGRTLILDSNPRDGTGRGYQPLSEVRLALWLKADMLVPGEGVTVYDRPGSESPLLITSAQRGRAFLGTVKSRSTVHPGLGPLDEKVSGATLVDWAAWAALTTFSSTGLRLGYNKPEVDAFRSAVRDTFLGVSEPPVRSDDVRGKQFPTHRPGYDKTQVDAFLEAAGLRLAAMESTDRPEEPLVSDALLVAWAEWADSTTFSKRTWRDGYEAIEVDPFREAIRDTFLGESQHPVRAHDVRGKQFAHATDPPHDGYDPKQIDAFLDAAGIRLAAMESTDRPEEPLVSGTILTDGPTGPTQQDFQPPRWAEWAEWADSTRFSTTRRKGWGYDTAEVDFATPVPVSELNSPAGDARPAIRIDGLELYFHSNRTLLQSACPGLSPQPSGMQDLWFSTRTSPTEPWSCPANLGSNVNTEKNDIQAHLSDDAETLYYSGNHGLLRDDIWLIRREQLPVNNG